MSVADTSGKTIANLGYECVTFEHPLYPGDSLYAETEVLEVRESKSARIAAWCMSKPARSIRIAYASWSAPPLSCSKEQPASRLIPRPNSV